MKPPPTASEIIDLGRRIAAMSDDARRALVHVDLRDADDAGQSPREAHAIALLVSAIGNLL